MKKILLFNYLLILLLGIVSCSNDNNDEELTVVNNLCGKWIETNCYYGSNAKHYEVFYNDYTGESYFTVNSAGRIERKTTFSYKFKDNILYINETKYTFYIKNAGSVYYLSLIDEYNNEYTYTRVE